MFIFPAIPMLFTLVSDSEDGQRSFTSSSLEGRDQRKEGLGEEDGPPCSISGKGDAPRSSLVPHLRSHYSHCTQEAKPLTCEKSCMSPVCFFLKGTAVSNAEA